MRRNIQYFQPSQFSSGESMYGSWWDYTPAGMAASAGGTIGTSIKDYLFAPSEASELSASTTSAASTPSTASTAPAASGSSAPSSSTSLPPIVLEEEAGWRKWGYPAIGATLIVASAVLIYRSRK